MSDLTVKFYNRYEISSSEQKEMHQIFIKYYRNADINTFKNDLDKKNGAFIVRKKSTGEIVGFSTLLEMRMKINGKKILGVFSGDTIIEEEYWGRNPMAFAYVKYFISTLISNPFTPIYWLLISKGYKTYLLLANNFLNHYPCYNRENKRLADISEAYSKYLFPDYYDDMKRIIDFGKNYQSLKGGVAEITGEMCEKFPKIAFFNEKNPTWDRGTELPCVGELNWATIVYRVFIKPVNKLAMKILTSIFPRKENRRLASQRKAI